MLPLCMLVAAKGKACGPWPPCMICLKGIIYIWLKGLCVVQVEVGHIMIEHRKPALLDSFFQVREGSCLNRCQISHSNLRSGLMWYLVTGSKAVVCERS